MSNIYDIIREKLRNVEDPVPGNAWEYIAEKKRRRRLIALPIFILMLIAGIGIGSYFYFNVSKTDQKTALTEQQAGHGRKTATVQVINLKKINKKQQDTIQEYGSNVASSNTDHMNDHAIKNHIILYQHIPQQPHVNIQDRSTENNTAYSHSPIGEKSSLVHEASPAKNEGAGKHASSLLHNTRVIKQQTKSFIKISKAVATDEDDDGNLVISDLTKEKSEEPTPKLLTRTNQAFATKESFVLENNVRNIVAIHCPTIKSLEPRNSYLPKKVSTSGTHAWYLDLAITAFSPISTYNHTTVFTRTLLLNNTKSEFSGNLQKTTINPSVAYSIALRKQLSKKLSLSMGFQFLQLNERISISGQQKNTMLSIGDSHLNIADEPAFVRDTQNIILEGPRRFDVVNRYTFIIIPVSMQGLIIKKGAWALYGEVGINLSLYNSYKNNIAYNNIAPLQAQSQPASKKTGMHIAALAGLKVSRSLNSNVELFANPLITYSPGSLHIKNSVIDKKIQLVGIGFGMALKL